MAIGPAWAQDGSTKKRSIDEKISHLRDRIAEANRREGVLTTEISAVTARIRGLEDDVDSASDKVALLERVLVVHKNRLAVLTQLLQFQTERLHLLRREHAYAQRRLAERLIRLYQTDKLSTVEVVLSASNISELVDGIEYVSEIGRQDRRIARQASHAKDAVAAARARTTKTRTGVERVTGMVEDRTDEQRAVRDRLVASQEALQDARSDKQETLANVQADEREYLHEVEGLERASAALGAQIRSAQAAAGSLGPTDSTP